jgi:hypothetical protein
MPNNSSTSPHSTFVKDGFEYQYGWIYSQKTLDTILGNQLAIIEAMGLPDKQELAIKSQIRQALYRPTRLVAFLTAEQVASYYDDKGDTRHLLGHSQIVDIA